MKELCLILLLVTGVWCQCSCPDGWTIYQGSCYWFALDQYRSFHDAEKYCSARNSHLVYVESSIENQFLKTFLQKFGTYRVWLGLLDEALEGVWKWSGTNIETNFTDWSVGEPDLNGKQHCVVFSETHAFHWMDLACSTDYPFICEQSATFSTIGVIG